MKRVTGIGGVFFTSEEPESLAAWYRERLGIPVNQHGYCDFIWRLADALRNEGVELADEVESHDYGRFGWITDPEGRRIELWEPGDESVLEEEPPDADTSSDPENGVVRSSVSVPVSAEEAFRVFTQGFGAWWPSAYTSSGEALEAIAIEGGVGGRCFERGPEGFECDWGRVLIWDPPRRVTFTDARW